MRDAADGKPEEPMYLAHPRSVTGGKVIIDGNDMDAVACERIEV